MAVPLLTLLGSRGVFNGAYGLDVADLMQYMAFIRDAGQHVLISNQFDVVRDPHLFFDPVFDLSGLLWHLGASIQLALLVWVPVVAAAIACSFLAYVRALVGAGRLAAAAALLLALFYLTPAIPLAQWLHGTPGFQFSTQVIGLEMFTAAYPWGGGPALALALMPVFLLAVVRLVEPGRRAPERSAAWYAGWAAAAGALTSWLHPWQGLTLLVILVLIVAWGRFDRRYLVLAIPATFTVAPLLYFYALSRTHSSWMAAAHSNGSPHWGWWLAAALAPAMLALPGYAVGARDVSQRILRVWPVAAFIVYLALDRTWFYHAFAGTSLPLAVLTVQGFQRLRLGGRLVPAPRLGSLLATLALAAATVPGLVWTVQQLVRTRAEHFFTPGEAAALRFLDHSRIPGPVLASVTPLGEAVPAFTGRRTYDGHYYWTPNYAARTAAAEALFAGRLNRIQTIAVLRDSRATFLAAACNPTNVDLRARLGPLLERAWHFGCATVYEVRPGSFQAQTMPASTFRAWVQTR